MLSIPTEKIEFLLNQAAIIESPIEKDEQSFDFDVAEDGWDERIADTEPYQALAASLEDLSAEELYELLALVELAKEDEAEKQPWNDLVGDFQDIPQDEAIKNLLRALIMTDAIETGLQKLGYGATLVAAGS